MAASPSPATPRLSDGLQTIQCLTGFDISQASLKIGRLRRHLADTVAALDTSERPSPQPPASTISTPAKTQWPRRLMWLTIGNTTMPHVHQNPLFDLPAVAILTYERTWTGQSPNQRKASRPSAARGGWQKTYHEWSSSYSKSLDRCIASLPVSGYPFLRCSRPVT